MANKNIAGQDAQREPENAEALNISPDEISVLAYQYWLEGGCQEDMADDDWFRAESAIKQNGETGAKTRSATA
jgi:hypothetical protein